MITIVLTYRNRELRIVKNCLDSLKNQSDKDFKVILVDYGSDSEFANKIESIAKNYSFITFISCPVSGQLWSKCRSINIALKETTTPYFMVGDIDLIFHPDFINIAKSKTSQNVLYFKYGFLSKEESLLEKNFEDFEIDFYGGEEVTGTTLFPTETLKSVNGYDEFYHGWGAEDTDIHIRMKNLGLQVEFYHQQTLVKHQWHPKAYRSKDSTSPFHSTLERVNHNYMYMTQSNNRTKVNLTNEWGKIPVKSDYQKLKETPSHTIKISPIEYDVAALYAQLKNYKDELVKIEIDDVDFIPKLKQKLKKGLKKKYFNYLNMETVNNLLLEEIIKNYRNQPYIYKFNRVKGKINLTILFN